MLLGLVALVGATSFATTFYEQWVPEMSKTADEQAVFSALMRAGTPLVRDLRLTTLAQRLLAESADSLDVPAITHEARALGWSDAQLSVLVLSRPDVASVGDALVRHLNEQPRELAPTHLGVAARSDTNGVRALMLTSRRMVTLSPFPAEVQPGQSAILSGIGADASTDALELVVSYPKGRIERRVLKLVGGLFRMPIDAGKDEGVMTVELLAHTPEGPKVAALLPIGVGGPVPLPADRAPKPGSDLLALVNDVRTHHGRPVLDALGEVSRVSQAHAEDMRGQRFFAHVSPTHGDVGQRLEHERVPYRRALENIAIGYSVEGILRQWVSSPGHLANLLDERVSHMGVGLTVDEGASPPRLVAVLTLLSAE